MIEHSVGSVDGNIILSNTHMDGQFLSNDGKTVIKSYTSASRVYKIYKIVYNFFSLS